MKQQRKTSLMNEWWCDKAFGNFCSLVCFRVQVLINFLLDFLMRLPFLSAHPQHRAHSFLAWFCVNVNNGFQRNVNFAANSLFWTAHNRKFDNSSLCRYHHFFIVFLIGWIAPQREWLLLFTAFGYAILLTWIAQCPTRFRNSVRRI